MVKHCVVCGKEVVVTNSRITCLEGSCSNIRRDRMSREWCEANRTTYWLRNSEKLKAYHRADYRKNRDARLAYQREYDKKRRSKKI